MEFADYIVPANLRELPAEIIFREGDIGSRQTKELRLLIYDHLLDYFDDAIVRNKDGDVILNYSFNPRKIRDKQVNWFLTQQDREIHLNSIARLSCVERDPETKLFIWSKAYACAVPSP